jgi:hypothetical protein
MVDVGRLLQDAVTDQLGGDRCDGGGREPGVAAQLDAGEGPVLAQRLKQQKPVLPPDEIAVGLLAHGPPFARFRNCTNFFALHYFVLLILHIDSREQLPQSFFWTPK